MTQHLPGSWNAHPHCALIFDGDGMASQYFGSNPGKQISSFTEASFPNYPFLEKCCKWFNNLKLFLSSAQILKIKKIETLIKNRHKNKNNCLGYPHWIVLTSYYCSITNLVYLILSSKRENRQRNNWMSELGDPFKLILAHPSRFTVEERGALDNFIWAVPNFTPEN